MGKTKRFKVKKVFKSASTDLDYFEKRKKNNEAIKKTREKTKARREDTNQRIKHLRSENEDLESRIQKLRAELLIMKEIYENHTNKRSQTDSEVISPGIETMETDEDQDYESAEDKKDRLRELINEIHILNNS